MKCPADGCDREIDMDKFACGYHWRLLARPIKDRVWARWNGTLAVDYDDLVAEANHDWGGR